MGAVQQLLNTFLRYFGPTPPPFDTLFNVVLTTFRNASLDPPFPSRRYVIMLNNNVVELPPVGVRRYCIFTKDCNRQSGLKVHDCISTYFVSSRIYCYGNTYGLMVTYIVIILPTVFISENYDKNVTLIAYELY